MKGSVFMPWESKTVEELRKEFVTAAQENGNFSALCREFGITRKTGYKWLERYAAQMSLSDMSRKPFNVTNRTPEEIEQLIIALRRENPGWGAKKLKCVLEKQGHTLPSARTVNTILNRYGCISEEESLNIDRLSGLKRISATKCGKQTSKVSSKWRITIIVFR